MSRKRRSPPQELEASRLVLRDSTGNVRILLDAGGDNGYASIYICSADGRGNMQVGTQPSGAVVMSFGNEKGPGMLTLSGDGMVVRAQDGRLGIVVGPIVDGTDNVTVYRDGQVVWSSATEPVVPKSSERTRKARGRKKPRGTGGK